MTYLISRNRPGHEAPAILFDEGDTISLYFDGGYGDDGIVVTQPGCELVVAYMNRQGIEQTAGTLTDTLLAAKRWRASL